MFLHSYISSLKTTNNLPQAETPIYHAYSTLDKHSQVSRLPYFVEF